LGGHFSLRASIHSLRSLPASCSMSATVTSTETQPPIHVNQKLTK
jgi:hypothetical protein